jgi:hypothetical protein
MYRNRMRGGRIIDMYDGRRRSANYSRNLAIKQSEVTS